MIGHLSGNVLAHTSAGSVISSGGVGYVVNISSELPIGCQAEIWVTTIVREDAITLFGFLTMDDQLVFNSLRAVTGVGPAQSLALLRGIGGHGVRAAVINTDVKALSAVKGIGPKVAERIVSMVRLAPPAADATPIVTEPASHVLAVQALTSLGYTEQVARDAVTGARDLVEFSDTDDEVALLITTALGRI